MPPTKPKKLTAQPVRTRQFAGKPAAAEEEEEEQTSSDESASEEEQPVQKPFAKPKPAPVASSFPKSAIKSSLASRHKTAAERQALEDEFETESEQEEEHGSDGSGSSNSGSGSEEDSSEEDDSSSEDEAPKKLLRPVFLKKNERNKAAAPTKSADELAAEQEAQRQQQAREVVQEQVEQRIAEKAAGKKDWDDDVEQDDINAIDDTDGLDRAAEYAAWKLRELGRIKRERLAMEEAEAERAELERRRALSTADRDAEDRAFIAQQQDAARADRDATGAGGQMQYMQKYFHKGAFFTDQLKELGVDRRNLMNARFEDQTDRSVLPEFMQLRDMSKLGQKGRTRYKDMRSEDTGVWGDFAGSGSGSGPRRDKRAYDGVDERFRSDAVGYRGERGGEGAGAGATGANAKPIGERKRGGQGEREEEAEARGTKRVRVEEVV